MVNFGRLTSSFSARLKASAQGSAGLKSAARVARSVRHDGGARLQDIVQASSTRWQASAACRATARVTDSAQYKTVAAAATSARIQVVKAAAPGVRAFNQASPRVKVIAAGGALAVLTGILAPTIASAQDSPTVADSSVTASSGAGGSGAGSSGAGGSGAAVADPGEPGGTYVAPPAGAPAVPTAAPSIADLHPTGIQGGQEGFTPTTQQMRNAQKIIQAGQAMSLPPRAWVIAVATSLQESALNNLGDLGASNDHDSLGLFQQRPSSGWGSPDQVMNPTYAAKAFYSALTQVPNWQRLNLTDAAQAVQVSAFPDHYAKWEAHAGDIVDAFYGQGPLAQVANKVM